MTKRIPFAPAALACALAAPSPAQILNAPVAPDAIYVVRTGAHRGLSIVDLNGYGGGTGDPTYDPTMQSFPPGTSHYPFNPNLRFQGSLLRPPLALPTSTLNGGSGGVFTLARDDALGDLHASAALVAPGDAMLGAPLDLVYNNAPAPLGCQAGGGSVCAIDGFHIVDVAYNGVATVQPTVLGGVSVHVAVGAGNPISFAPHPNPPPIQGLPTCMSPLIRGIEPTSIETITQVGLSNLLVPGDPFGNPAQGVPPTGLLSVEQNAFFVGPSLPQVTIPACQGFQIRQQVGHFLYVIDRAQHDVAVLNSNTLEVIARIATPDPTELAMSPNLRLLAVSNHATDSVTFVDIDPRSSSFHQVHATVSVGDGPRGIAWEPDDEDVLVCNELGASVSIVSTANLQVRKTVRRGLHAPFAIAVTPRQNGFGHQRGVYFAWILDRNGQMTLFESGPSGVNGWGFDEIIGQTRFVLASPKAIQPDPRWLNGAVWVAHEGQVDPHGAPTGLGGGAVTLATLGSTTVGTIPLHFGDVPNLRGLSFHVARSIGSDHLTGIPTDLAFDDLRNFGALENVGSASGPPAPVNGKNLVRRIGPDWRASNAPKYLFVPVRDPASGVGRGIDVLSIDTYTRFDVNPHEPGVQSVRARGAELAVDYFRQ